MVKHGNIPEVGSRFGSLGVRAAQPEPEAVVVVVATMTMTVTLRWRWL